MHVFFLQVDLNAWLVGGKVVGGKLAFDK